MPLTAARLVAAIAIAAALSACGGATGVEPKAWAKSVCTALRPWRDEIGALTKQVQQQMASATTPVQTKQNLLTLVTGAQTASDTALTKLKAAGTPAVEQGDRIAVQFANAVNGVRDAYAHARTAIEALNTGDAKAFYTAVAATFHTLDHEVSGSDLDTNKVGSVELRHAFDEVPECR